MALWYIALSKMFSNRETEVCACGVLASVRRVVFGFVGETIERVKYV